MAAVQITGVSAMIADIQRQKLRMHGKITQGVRAVAAAVFKDLVVNTPQYSGNLVMNWRITHGAWTANYKPIASYGVRTKEPYQRGDNPAVAQALGAELFKLDSIRWNSKITITNAAPYAGEVEAGRGPTGSRGEPLEIRDENKVNEQVVMGAMIQLKYELGGAAVQKALRGL